jgi:hypothetical protein
VSHFRDTPPRWLALLCCFGAFWFHASVAQAQQAESASVAQAQQAESASVDGRSGFTFDLALSAGGASAEFTESDYPVADFEALSLGVDARWGWFIGHHVLLGAELALSWHAAVNPLRVDDRRGYFSNGSVPAQASYEVVAPLGAFVALYPVAGEGLFFGASAGVGLLGLPQFAAGDTGFMSGYSFELGYELSRSAKRGPALFLRYSRWAAEESPISSEHPDGLVSRELLLGARWSFWTPEWR